MTVILTPLQRQWKETKEALQNMVNAAKFYRNKA